MNKYKDYLVFGVGVNDLPDHKTKVINEQGVRVSCPIYVKWHSMLRRCYSKVLHQNNPAYIGCVVCDEWKYFSNFKAWMLTQDWEGKDLDKDWRVIGNKVYSPETCLFIDGKLNSFICNSFRGVDFHKKTGKFRARVSDPFIRKTVHLGLFSTREAANNASLAAKICLANKWLELKPEYSEILNNFIILFRKEVLSND